jgi:hypothetical protein
MDRPGAVTLQLRPRNVARGARLELRVSAPGAKTLSRVVLAG